MCNEEAKPTTNKPEDTEIAYFDEFVQLFIVGLSHETCLTPEEVTQVGWDVINKIEALKFYRQIL